MSNMAREWDDILDECLDRVLWRNEPVDRCLADYPEHADELRELLQAALATRRVLAFVPKADSKRAARQRFLAALEKRQSRPRLLSSWWLHGWRRWATAATAGLVALALGAGGTVAAAGGSVPGEPLYPVKRTAENLRLALTPSDESRTELYAEYAERRVQEISTLTSRGETQHLPGLSRALESALTKASRLAGVQVIIVPPATPPAGPPSTPPTVGQRPVVEPVGPAERGTRPPGLDQERLQQLLEEKFRRNQQTLEDVMERVSPAARPAVQEALEKTRQAHKEVLEAQKQQLREDSEKGRPEHREVTVKGILVMGDVAAHTFDVRLPDGGTLTLRVTQETRITLNSRRVAPTALRPGDRLEVEFDKATREALKIEAKREQPQKPSQDQEDRAERQKASVRGVLVSGDPATTTLSVRLPDGRMLPLQVIQETGITLNGHPVDPTALRPGDRLEVEFDKATREALKIEAKREQPRD